MYVCPVASCAAPGVQGSAQDTGSLCAFSKEIVLAVNAD